MKRTRIFCTLVLTVLLLSGCTAKNGSGTENITTDEAKQIALDQVPGATVQDIRAFQSDYDNGNLQYEGKIYYEQMEYEFEIDAATGTILKWDMEPFYD